MSTHITKTWFDGEKIVTQEIPEYEVYKQEPVAWYDKHGMVTHDPFEGIRPLYAAPPQRQWVGLTKEEAKEISLANRPYVIDMIAALEARLKEKNGG